MTSIGIDLGTTNSVASFWDGRQPQPIPNRHKELLTPSVISFRRTASGSGEYLVGIEARNYAAQAPRDTIYSVKRLMGLNFDQPNVQQVLRQVPYRVCGPSGGEDIGARVVVNDEQLTPIDVSAMILRQIKEDSERQLRRPIDAATITVPAYFLDCQRNATKDAGVRAGFRLHPLLDEPIAAALGFGVGRDPREGHRVLVYDLGGGTFDVSVIQMSGDNLQVLTKRGDMWLGGDDFDQLIVQRIRAWIGNHYGVDAGEDPAVKRLLKEHAESAKKRLSLEPQAEVLEACLFNLPDGRPLSLDLTVTRKEFETDIQPLVQRSLELADEAIREATLEDRHLTAVLLVGGSTLVPYIRETLLHRFCAEKVRFDANPMLCVSLGAAVWCERFPLETDGRINRKNYDRTGIPTPMDLGVEVYCGGNRHHFDVVIPRNTPYPTLQAIAKEFFPTMENQRLVRVPVFQGNQASTTRNTPQGIIEAELPHGIPAHTPVIITFEIDEHGNLSGDLDIRGFPELRRPWSIRRNQPLLGQKELERLKHWRADVEQALALAHDFVERFGPYQTAEEKRELAERLQQLRQALERDDRLECQKHRRDLEMILLSSGTASTLYLASRAAQLAGNSAVAKQIVGDRVKLENAFRAGKQDQVKLLQDRLMMGIHQVFKALGPAAERGPLNGQLTPGSR